jgi:hypothetical protein
MKISQIRRSPKMFLATGLIALFGFGCTERIDIELDETYTRLVVNANLTTDTSAHLVELTKTTSYYYNEAPPAVTGAQVEISDNTGDRVELTEKEPGKYYTPDTYFAVPGRTYDLRIVLAEPVNEKEVYTATSGVTPIHPIDSIHLMPQPDWGIDGFFEVQCYYQDPPSKEFYMFNIFKNGVWLTDTISRRFISDDVFYNGSYTNGIGVGYLDQSREKEKVYPGDTITFQGCSITEDYYNFILALQTEASGFSNPLFSGPPANVVGNISDGALGFFAVYSTSYASTVYYPAP